MFLRRKIWSKLVLLCVVVLFVVFYFKTINITGSNSLQNAMEKDSMPQKQFLKQQMNHPSGHHPQLVTVDNYEEMVLHDLKKQEPNLGAKGRVAELSGDDKYIGEKQLAVIALNEELSEHISYNRTIPDARNPKCRTVEFDINSLPTVTVIIIFFNEPYSVLVRTVHSVINTSPPNLLKEVVLVDDSSTNEELKGKLDHYVNTRLSSKVKLLRLRNR